VAAEMENPTDWSPRILSPARQFRGQYLIALPLAGLSFRRARNTNIFSMAPSNTNASIWASLVILDTIRQAAVFFHKRILMQDQFFLHTNWQQKH
jgi:hypothetical protein